MSPIELTRATLVPHVRRAAQKNRRNQASKQVGQGAWSWHIRWRCRRPVTTATAGCHRAAARQPAPDHPAGSCCPYRFGGAAAGDRPHPPGMKVVASPPRAGHCRPSAGRGEGSVARRGSCPASRSRAWSSVWPRLAGFQQRPPDSVMAGCATGAMGTAAGSMLCVAGDVSGRLTRAVGGMAAEVGATRHTADGTTRAAHAQDEVRTNSPRRAR